MISFMTWLDRNYIRQTTVSRGNAVVEISISSAPLFRFYSPHIFPQTSSNFCKKCWFSLFLWNKLITHNSIHIKINIRKHFCAYFRHRYPMLSSVTSSERKCECLTFLLSVLVRTDAILFLSAHQSAYKAEILTQSITNSVRCQNLMAYTKGLPNLLANLWTVTHLLSHQIP